MNPTTPPDDEFEATIVSHGPLPERGAEPEAIGHYLVAVEGDALGKRVEVGQEPVTIGRDARQTLVFAGDTELSRLHARVTLSPAGVFVEDLRSTNGTFINAQRLSTPTLLREGDTLRAGHQRFRYERRARRDVEQARALDRDLLRASDYVKSILPPPLRHQLLRADWSFLPSAQLGGDAFGYDWLDAERFAFYLMDVSGHGVRAAMHSVSVMNLLRQRALPDVDFSNPADVLSSLNDRFQMDDHDAMYFTIWYGVYDTSNRTVVFSAAGHHPAHLIPPDRSQAIPLGEPDLMIGAIPHHRYGSQSATVLPGSMLHLFSDGVFEIVVSDGRQWSLDDFVPLLLDPPLPNVSEPDRLYRLVRAAARPGLLDDDFSLLSVTFE